MPTVTGLTRDRASPARKTRKERCVRIWHNALFVIFSDPRESDCGSPQILRRAERKVLAKIGSNIISLFIVFGLLYWVSMARLIRGQILSLREQEYVLASQAAGARGSWVIKKHLLPNCISVVIISTALQIPSAIFTESYLSFLGLGVNAPMPSLGSLASDALNGLSSYPFRLVIPALVISLIVLSLNLFGDGLRDAFDPKLRK